MAIREIITANCENGQLSKSKIARQWDDQGTLIQFAGYPEPETDEELIFRLIVWMRASEDAEPVELPPIELEADQWLISNYYTQLPQMLRFQLCITNEAGTYEKHSPIFSGIVDKSLSHNGEGADIDVIPLFDPYKKYVDELILDAGARVVDTELDETSTHLVENKAVASAVADVNGRLNPLNEAILVSKNLYNKDTDVLGYNVDSTGAVIELSGYRLSEYIEIPLNGLAIPFIDQTTSSGAYDRFYNCAFYDQNKNFLSRNNTKLSDTSGTLVVTRANNSGNARYVRLGRLNNSVSATYNLMVNAGNALLEYEPYHDPQLKDDAQSESFYDVQAKAEKAYNITDQLFYFDGVQVDDNGVAIRTNGAVGSTVDTTPAENTSYIYAIVPCAKDDRVIITGTGGSAYRLWCWTDDNYVIKSRANSDVTLTDTTLTAPADGYLICNFLKTRPMSLQIKKPINGDDYSDLVGKVNNIIDSPDSSIVNAINTGGKYVFGDGLSLDYRVTDIPALVYGNSPLTYFYGLFDALMARFPEYITKVNCDTDAGITQPNYMVGYPIYLYKFIPPYTPKTSGGSVDNTLANVLKVMLIGGTHPEYTAIDDLYHTMRLICENWSTDDNLFELRFVPSFYVFPCQGSWGVEQGTRVNYNGVDLNRNMPTSEWVESGSGTNTYTGPTAGSEYESKILIHYLDEIKPNIVIDHHNSSLATAESLIYCISHFQLGNDVATHFIEIISKKWQQQYPNVFGSDTTKVYGFVEKPSGQGKRSQYASEHGMLGITYESQAYLCYSNNGQFDSENYERYTTMVETLATDGFLNFLLRVLHTYCNRHVIT